MGRTLGSALTLSTIGLGSKLVVKWLAKKFDVRGLPILLNALKEPDLELSWKKGKGKLVDNVQEKPKLKRRGIVTGECMNVGVADELVCNHNSVVDDPLVCFRVYTRRWLMKRCGACCRRLTSLHWQDHRGYLG